MVYYIFLPTRNTTRYTPSILPFLWPHRRQHAVTVMVSVLVTAAPISVTVTTPPDTETVVTANTVVVATPAEGVKVVVLVAAVVTVVCGTGG